MQSRCSVFLMVTVLFFSVLSWGQIIGTSAQSPPVPPAPQPAPQPDAKTGQPSGGDFSNVLNPDPKTVVPKDTIIVKGAWSSASDRTTPLPEGGAVTSNIFTDQYFGITYPLPSDWVEKYTPP